MSALLAAVLDLLLPAVCPGCHEACGPRLCAACRAGLPAVAAACPWCAAPLRAGAAGCAACAGAGIPHIHRVSVAHPYRGPLAELVGEAKAGASSAAVAALAELLPAPPDDAPAGGCVVPIPPSRGRRPGPHLGTALAVALARRSGRPLRHLLATTRLAAEQHLLTAAGRRANVDGLFRCAATPPAYVILVDDLLTSGATASAAAAALRAAGTTRVDLICLARTPRHDDPRHDEDKQSSPVQHDQVPSHRHEGGSGEAAWSGGRQTPRLKSQH